MTQSKLFKQFNKLMDCSTADIDDDTKGAYKLALKMIIKANQVIFYSFDFFYEFIKFSFP
jgi:hypothetical protein